ncbi:hypothetical protein FRC17_010608 [Serendipita sp. 399]|nr:hypothetical protein FRC17_010608 [Serendipita sp. 399]
MAALSQRPTHPQSSAGGFHRRGGRVPPPHLVELSRCLVDFVVQLLPSNEEVSVKEDVRKLLERLIKTIEPSAQLLSFGSTANGFELKNSDMDLCCLLNAPSDPPISASEFVVRAAQLLERETKFTVKPLPLARIPIIKLSLPPSPSIPFGIACDIGFENRLALENTRLLFTYAAIDPERVRTLVLFLKLWSKRRKINSPYHGTLSSYGYTLLVIFFLVHVKNPPVLPNLQQMPPLRSISPDPFATDFNVGRCVTRDGLYTIRGEFMRALRILNARQQGAPMSPTSILSSLCEERDSEVPKSACHRNSYRPTGSPRSQSAGVSPVIPRLGLSNSGNQSQESFKPQFAPSTPITLTAPPSNPPIISVPATPLSHVSPVGLPHVMVPPPHMAPQRGKWTSPPPDHAPPQRHNSFNERLASGIKLAVTHPPMERVRTSSSPGSSATDEDVDDIPDAVCLDTRSSSPLSSTSMLEFISQNNSVTPIPEDTSTTPKPVLASQSPFPPPSSPFSQSHTESRGRENPLTRTNLPSLAIPPLFPPQAYSANNAPWSIEYGTSPYFGTIPPSRSNYGYREGPRHGRSNYKTYAPTNSYSLNHSRVPYSPHYTSSFGNGVPQQLPTPPVSSPCSNQQHSPPSTSSPLLRLDELASTSAR